jgi:para-nitrobenzyl esterase
VKRRAGLAAALTLLAATGAQSKPIAVDGGSIEGVTLKSGISAWLGVPFAAPPVRGLRWKAPQPVQAWGGIYHADRFAPECLQPLRGSSQNHYFGIEATSEDCLYLNIWASKTTKKAPVVVWIYGGGFNIGSASMANYSGEPLAHEGVVRVNLAYRVGPLGFLALPELSKESGYGGSGNYGLMDQIAALQWIKRNISKFGGDPGNITIVGQSAGSMSVSLLQISPAAKGLFHRAIGMSGSAFGGMIAPAPLAKAEAEGLALQKEIGAASLAELRGLPGDKIISATTQRSAIAIDGRVITGTAEEVFAAKRQNDVPVLIGYTLDESFRPFGPVASAADEEKLVKERFGGQADRVLAAYGTADPARAAADIGRDSTVGLQMAEWARFQRAFGKQPAYAFLFTRRQPYAPGVQFSDHDPATAGAYHSGDIPYWLKTQDAFNMFRPTRVWEPGDRALAADMSQALLSFARTGKPTSKALGAWPSFDPTTPRLMWLGLESRAIAWPHFADMPLFANGQAPARSSNARPRD